MKKPIVATASVVPVSWMPEVFPAPHRIIIHWTAGAYKANAIDRAAYHILIEGDGKLVRGTHSIADNTNTGDGKYAAHTLGSNTGCIGVSMCCMAGCVERPFRAGEYPLMEVQWDVMSRVCAELALRYGISVLPRTVLGHGEVQTNLGIKQKGKWDPLVLPWDTKLSYMQVGAYLRACVQRETNVIQGVATPPEAPARIKVVVTGKTFDDAIIEDGVSLVALRPLSEALGWSIVSATGGTAKVVIAGQERQLPYEIEDGRGFVACRELAAALGREPRWDPTARTVTI